MFAHEQFALSELAAAHVMRGITMDIHHAMVVHNQPNRLYKALTQSHDLQLWMGVPTLARPEVGSVIEFHFDQGQRILKQEMEL